MTVSATPPSAEAAAQAQQAHAEISRAKRDIVLGTMLFAGFYVAPVPTGGLIGTYYLLNNKCCQRVIAETATSAASTVFDKSCEFTYAAGKKGGELTYAAGKLGCELTYAVGKKGCELIYSAGSALAQKATDEVKALVKVVEPTLSTISERVEEIEMFEMISLPTID